MPFFSVLKLSPYRAVALFAVLLVSTVASAGIITISATNDKNSTYNERATKDTSIVSQAESSNINDFNYTQAWVKFQTLIKPRGLL